VLRKEEGAAGIFLAVKRPEEGPHVLVGLSGLRRDAGVDWLRKAVGQEVDAFEVLGP